MCGWHLNENVDTLPTGLFTRKETICDQLIKLIKCDQSVIQVVSFEYACKVEEQQSGCYNLVASWLAWRYKG